MVSEQTLGRGKDGSMREPSTPVRDYFRTTWQQSALGLPSLVRNELTKANSELSQLNEEHRRAHMPHLANSRRGITATAERAISQSPHDKPKKALILGAGSCYDIPLEGLAHRFDELTIVDLDPDRTAGAIRQLSPGLQQKITLVGADVSGITGGFTKAVDDVVNDYTDPITFVQDAIDLSRDFYVQGQSADFGNDFTFVSSQLLMSQLHLCSVFFFLTTMQEQQNVRKFHMSDKLSGKYMQNLITLKDNIQKEHLAGLAQSVAPYGLVHLADTYRKRTKDEESYMINLGLLRTEVDKRFTRVKLPDSWTWNFSPGEQVFDVFSEAFQVKAS